MAKGTIRRLIGERGFGFITTGQGEDIFFHRSELEGLDFDSLREGQQVESGVGRGRNGRPQALKVKVAQPQGE